MGGRGERVRRGGESKARNLPTNEHRNHKVATFFVIQHSSYRNVGIELRFFRRLVFLSGYCGFFLNDSASSISPLLTTSTPHSERPANKRRTPPSRVIGYPASRPRARCQIQDGRSSRWHMLRIRSCRARASLTDPVDMKKSYLV